MDGRQSAGVTASERDAPLVQEQCGYDGRMVRQSMLRAPAIRAVEPPCLRDIGDGRVSAHSGLPVNRAKNESGQGAAPARPCVVMHHLAHGLFCLFAARGERGTGEDPQALDAESLGDEQGREGAYGRPVMRPCARSQVWYLGHVKDAELL